MIKIKQLAIVFSMVLFSTSIFAQQPSINFYSPADQTGLNVFETSKEDTVEFTGLKVRIGGNFTQQFQALTHSNTAQANDFPFGAGTVDLNKLYPIANGFNLATANLRFDIQLEDGIRVTLENYMSSRHHSEFWVKGGYIQIDKLPFLGNPEWFSKYLTVKIGHFAPNYGDQQFRRSDNGNTFHNPFVGNYIMDAFTTEIGGELYIRPVKDVFVMFGMNGGLINGDVKEAYNADGDVIKKNPSILAKVGYDSQINDNLRVRLSASLYNNSGTTRNTLYAGDRTGSRYYMVAEPEYYRNFRAGGAVTASSPGDRFTSGRISPDFTHKVTSISINPFVKFYGLEVFGTYEMASGTNVVATDATPDPEIRKVNQLAGELVYRFLKNEQAFVGARYNTVSGRLANYNNDISVNRTQLSLGWYTTKNLLVKLEYVNQVYNDFVDTDYRNGLEFKGIMLEAAIAF